jgi:hypothetical protein
MDIAFLIARLSNNMPPKGHIAIGALLNYVLSRWALHKDLIACDDRVFIIG